VQPNTNNDKDEKKRKLHLGWKYYVSSPPIKLPITDPNRIDKICNDFKFWAPLIGSLFA
jgi:hypothetical protein